MTDSVAKKLQTSALFGGNAPFIEDYYERYLEDPQSVEPHWRAYFNKLADGHDDVAHSPIRAEFAKRKRRSSAVAAAATWGGPGVQEKQAAVLHFIERHRLIGHQAAHLDPLGISKPEAPPDLQPEHYGLTEADMNTEFSTGNYAGGGRMTLREILQTLRAVYCGPVGAEFMHVTDTAERRWLQGHFEATGLSARLSDEEQIELLKGLTAAEGIERYLHTRYVGQKRFSLEGGESLLPMLDDLIRLGCARGLADVVIGMAHRGRINLLVNILGKSPRDLFTEFEGIYDSNVHTGSGDVKYHMGFSSDLKTPHGNIHVALAFNPSHLEIVDPVVEGSVRARQERRNDPSGDLVMPVLIHGDAAFAGQGVVMETLQLSQTRGFYTGGTVHIVCNNQIGFTISNPLDARSTRYCTDVAKMIEAPVFHVNGDDPHAVILVTRLALDYRMKFHKDVVIDLISYRRHGHNEADEPAVTQPLMYRVIRKHPPVRQLYAQRLADEGVLDKAQADQMVENYRDGLDEGHVVSLLEVSSGSNKFVVDWTPYKNENSEAAVATALSAEQFKTLSRALTIFPAGFELHPRASRIMQDRMKMANGEMPMDWGFAELLAYASLVGAGNKVRLTGQDSRRGTFFHRHAVLFDQGDKQSWTPLQHIADGQASFEVTDSLLSEEAVLGFEYGYSASNPDALVVWEAQFGDFANGAQVVIDQFISSGEEKWDRWCGLTMFLPHGYEGQGPEHSSARLERYLQLCAEHNMQVCVPSTPAQMFHMLRRQMLRSFRKPLIVMTPKSLLRHKQSVSTVDDITQGHFSEVIDDVGDIDKTKAKRVVFCSGKIYYDLLEARTAAGIEDVPLVRIEQLYPFLRTKYAEIVAKYPSASEIVWCQEEPQNQGAWYQIHHRLVEPLKAKQKLIYTGREAHAAPAAGFYQLHLEQQRALVADALGLNNK